MSAEVDFDVPDLIGHLCLEAGRIMEDYCVVLSLALPIKQHARAERLDQLQLAAADITALAAAAQALHRRYGVAVG